MSLTEATAAIAKLKTLSEERANKVFSLIEDLAELEALEDAEDLRDAKEALVEVSAATALPGKVQLANTREGREIEGPTIPYDQLRRGLGLDS